MAEILDPNYPKEEEYTHTEKVILHEHDVTHCPWCNGDMFFKLKDKKIGDFQLFRCYDCGKLYGQRRPKEEK